MSILNKNFLVLSYGIKEFDGRLKEIIRSCKLIGPTKIVCLTEQTKQTEKMDMDFSFVYVKKRKYLGLSLYLNFLLVSITKFLKMKLEKKTPIVVVDNFYVAPIGWIIKLVFPKTIVIQDCRELYFKEDMPGFGKILCYFEEKMIKKANLVFCANVHRSNIMKEKYSLSVNPTVFDNIRTLDGEFEMSLLEEKYKEYFNYRWNIVSTGGFSLARKTADLVEGIHKLCNLNIGLFIVGSGTPSDKKELENIVSMYKMTNVYFIDRVPMDELRYIVQKCHIGVVSYHQKDLNNEYCSSGKIYEYLSEGLPVVTTENLPLREFCQTYQVGVANNFFDKSITEIINNYESFSDKVHQFPSDILIEENNNAMVVAIRKVLN